MKWGIRRLCYLFCGLQSLENARSVVVHWPVDVFLLDSVHVSLGQWKHVHCHVDDNWSSKIDWLFGCDLLALIGGGRVLTASSARPYLGATRPRVGIVNLGVDTPSWQYFY